MKFKGLFNSQFFKIEYFFNILFLPIIFKFGIYIYIYYLVEVTFFGEKAIQVLIFVNNYTPF